jgi:VWFA-related protein
MRCRVTAWLLLLWLACAAAAAGQQQQQVPPVPSAKQEQVIPVQVELVNLVFTVVNNRQRFITDLERANFKVLEDGQEQKIEFFSRQTDLPLRVGILMDTSNSIRERLKFEQEAAIDFIHNVLRRKKDQAFLMTFDSEAGLIEDYTDDAGRLSEAVQRQRAGGGTSLYDAIYFACHERLTTPPLPTGQNPEVRRLIVVLSDGDDTGSARARSEALEACQRAETAIYAISTSTDWLSLSGDAPKKIHRTPGDQVLEQFSKETGGRVFFPYKVDDLGQSFLEIADELRSQYALAYTPSNKKKDGKFRAIQIAVDRKGLQVRARKGYYAVPASSAVRPGTN